MRAWLSSTLRSTSPSSWRWSTAAVTIAKSDLEAWASAAQSAVERAERQCGPGGSGKRIASSSSPVSSTVTAWPAIPAARRKVTIIHPGFRALNFCRRLHY